MGIFKDFFKEGLGLEKKDCYCLNLNIDNKGEPFVEVKYYINGAKFYLNHQEKIDKISIKAPLMTNHFDIPESPVQVIICDGAINEISKLKQDVDKKQFSNSKEYGQKFIVAYIIDPKSDISYDEKVALLYDIMCKNMSKEGSMSVMGVPLNQIDFYENNDKIDPEVIEENKSENIRFIEVKLGVNLGKSRTK